MPQSSTKRKTKVAAKGNDKQDGHIHLVMLFATSSFECSDAQQEAFNLLEEWDVPFETLDGSDPMNKTVRNHLWTLLTEEAKDKASDGSRYPQFFIRQKPQPGQRTFTYLGNMEHLKMICSHWTLYHTWKGVHQHITVSQQEGTSLLPHNAHHKLSTEDSSTSSGGGAYGNDHMRHTVPAMSRSSPKSTKSFVSSRGLSCSSPPRVVQRTYSSPHHSPRSPMSRQTLSRSVSQNVPPRSPSRGGLIKDDSNRTIQVTPVDRHLGGTGGTSSSVAAHLDKAKACTARLDALMAQAAYLRQKTSFQTNSHKHSNRSDSDDTSSSSDGNIKAYAFVYHHDDPASRTCPSSSKDTTEETVSDNATNDHGPSRESIASENNMEEALRQVELSDSLSSNHEDLTESDNTSCAWSTRDVESVQSILLLQYDIDADDEEEAILLDDDAQCEVNRDGKVSESPDGSEFIPTLPQEEESVADSSKATESDVLTCNEETKEEPLETSSHKSVASSSEEADEPSVNFSHNSVVSSDDESDNTGGDASDNKETEKSSADSELREESMETTYSVDAESIHDFDESGHSQGTDPTTDSSESPKVPWVEDCETSKVGEPTTATVRYNTTASDEDGNESCLESTDPSRESEVEESDTNMQDELKDHFDSQITNGTLGDFHNSWKLAPKDATETTEMESFSNLTDSIASLGVNIIYPKIDYSENDESSSTRSCTTSFEKKDEEDEASAAGRSESNILILIATQTVDRETPYDQQNAIYTIVSHGVDYFTIDASDPMHKELRNELLRMSGRGPRYPQFFNVRGDDVQFLGDMKDFSKAIDGECLDDWLRPEICA